MEHVLIFLVLILSLIVVITLMNEKIFNMPNEIAILIFTLLASVFVSVLVKAGVISLSNSFNHFMDTFRIDKILLDVVLCFMLFTGASELKLPELVNNFKPISLLALLTTVITSAIYGLMFWGLTNILGLHLGFTLCFLLGSIVSPTDPIAATGILNKLGLSKNVTAVMEGESLFNDGTGVALFIFIKDLYTDSKGSNFFFVMFKELFGALFVGMAISFLFFFLIKATTDPIKHIITSILAVSLSYTICETYGFSGVIASVVCGIYFSTMMDKYKAANKSMDPDNYYKDFWKVIDTLLNYFLYTLVGLSFMYVGNTDYLIVIAIAAIIFNIVARALGVFISTVISRQLPDGYHIKPFTILMTWGGLKGGLCLALAMSAVDFLPKDAYNFVLFVTYITILFTTIFQGLTIGKLFKWLNANESSSSEDKANVVE